jgi:DNA-binding XRE family transcriptional regulator
MPTAAKPSSEDVRQARIRAVEWKSFRRDFLFSQKHLAYALRCSRRTICAIEGGEVVHPHVELLRRFRDLKRRQERVNGSPARYTGIADVFAQQRGA